MNEITPTQQHPLKDQETTSITIIEMPNFVRVFTETLNGITHFGLQVKRTIDNVPHFHHPNIFASSFERAETLAAEYSILHELPLLLDNDEDGLIADRMMQAAAERSEHNELSTLWMT